MYDSEIEELVRILQRANVSLPVYYDIATLRQLYEINRERIAATEDDVAGATPDKNENLSKVGFENSTPKSAPPTFPQTEQNQSNAPTQQHTSNMEPSSIGMNSTAEQVERTQPQTDDEEALLASLRRRHEILRLQKEIEEMERGVPNTPIEATPPPTLTRRVHFADIQHAIVRFSGDDRTYSVHDYFSNLDRIFRQVNADELLKNLTLRNTLTGTAEILKKMGTLTYDELKEKLITKFGRAITRPEVYQALRIRTQKANESHQRYVTEMEAIRGTTDVTDDELVTFILNGMRRTRDFELFASAQTMADIQRAIEAFERRQVLLGHPIGSQMDAKAEAKPKPLNNRPTGRQAGAEEEDRCFNCSRRGHKRQDCMYEDRPRDVCFQCWQSGHDRRSCTNARYVQKLKTTVAAVTEMPGNAERDDENDQQSAVREAANALSAVNLVSVAFVNSEVKCDENTTLLSLFDTGSPANLIRRSAVPFEVNEKLIKTKFCGLGKTSIYSYGKLNCEIKFRGKCNKVVFLVVADETIPVPLLMGRDSLQKFGIGLYMIDRNTLNILNVSQKTPNKQTKQNKTEELCFCSVDLGVSEKVALMSIDLMPSALTSGKNDLIDKTKGKIIQERNTVGGQEPFETNTNHDERELLFDDDEEKEYMNLIATMFDNTGSEDAVETAMSLGEEAFTIFAIAHDSDSNDLNINPQLSEANSNRIRQLISDEYLHSTVEVTPLDYEMIIRLDSDVPFHYAPRRLAYMERAALKKSPMICWKRA